MGSGGGNDQSGSGGQSLDDVAEERDGQANGREQCLDLALEVDHGLPGPDGDSNENDNNNAGNGSDDNDGDHSNIRVENKTNDAEEETDGDPEVNMTMDTVQAMDMEKIYLMMVQKKMLHHLLIECMLMKLFIF